MKIHIVREPFLCREGQFESGRRSLCVGLDYETLKNTDEFWCYLGKNRKTHYEIKRSDALSIGQTWKNPKGKTVIIVPISNFEVVNSDWDEEKYEEKEHKRAVSKAEAQRLL
jgi:hypothetical protein